MSQKSQDRFARLIPQRRNGIILSGTTTTSTTTPPPHRPTHPTMSYTENPELSPQASSPTGSTISKSGRRRRKKRSLTVEDLFTSVSNAKAFGECPPPPRYVLTPRSAESCLREGVDPEHLRIRDLDSFWEPGLDAARQGMRHEAYSERRHTFMKSLRRARTTIINAETAKARNSGKARVGIAAQMAAESQKKESGMLEMEAKRLAKMQRRQKKEIEQLIQFEMKTAEIREQAQRKLEAEEKRALRAEKERLRRQKEMAEERRMKQLKRQAQEELEEQKRRALARHQFLKDKQLTEEKRRMEKVRAMETRKQERDRQRKAEEHRLQTERILADQQAQIDARMAEMKENEKARKSFMAKKNQEMKAAQQQKRQMIKRRIHASQNKLERIESKKKEDYYQRLEESESRRKKRLDMEEMERLEQKKLRELSDRKRKMILEETRREEAMRVHELVSRQEQAEENLANVMEQKMRMHTLKRERINLNMEAKMINVERQKRVAEYKRLQTLRKIKADEEKVLRIEVEKERMLQRRKKAAVEVKLRRDKIAQSMQKLRKTKKMPNDLLGGEEEGTPGKRKKKKKKKKGSMGPSASEPTLRAPPPMPAEVRARAEAARMGETQPMSFMSPYEGTAKVKHVCGVSSFVVCFSVDSPLFCLMLFYQPTPQRAPNADTVPAFASVQAGGVVTF